MGWKVCYNFLFMSGVNSLLLGAMMEAGDESK